MKHFRITILATLILFWTQATRATPVYNVLLKAGDTWSYRFLFGCFTSQPGEWQRYTQRGIVHLPSDIRRRAATARRGTAA